MLASVGSHALNLGNNEPIPLPHTHIIEKIGSMVGNHCTKMYRCVGVGSYLSYVEKWTAYVNFIVLVIYTGHILLLLLLYFCTLVLRLHVPPHCHFHYNQSRTLVIHITLHTEYHSVMLEERICKLVGISH